MSSAGGKNKGGRPSKYREEFAEQARKLCLLGATDAEMADFFGVAVSTLNAWKKEQPGFFQSITRGKMLADAEVAEKLYQRAMGYSHKATKMFQSSGTILSEEYTEHYPPDTQAASLWLRNRQPRKWRDKQEVEHAGKSGAPIEAQVVIVPAKQRAEVRVEPLAASAARIASIAPIHTENQGGRE